MPLDLMRPTLQEDGSVTLYAHYASRKVISIVTSTLPVGTREVRVILTKPDSLSDAADRAAWRSRFNTEDGWYENMYPTPTPSPIESFITRLRRRLAAIIAP